MCSCLQNPGEHGEGSNLLVFPLLHHYLYTQDVMAISIPGPPRKLKNTRGLGREVQFPFEIPWIYGPSLTPTRSWYPHTPAALLSLHSFSNCVRWGQFLSPFEQLFKWGSPCARGAIFESLSFLT